MSEELMKCPFCGGEAYESVIADDDDEHYWYVCNDVNCNAEGPKDLGASGAIDKWNTRPIEDELQRKLDIAVEFMNICKDTFEDPLKYDEDMTEYLRNILPSYIERLSANGETSQNSESDEVVKRCDTLQRKLDIAVEALKLCAIPYPYPHDRKQCDIAFDALAEIEKCK